MTSLALALRTNAVRGLTRIQRAISLLRSQKAVYWRDPGDLDQAKATWRRNLLTNSDAWNKYTGTDGSSTVTQQLGDAPFTVPAGVALVTKNTSSGSTTFYQYATSQPYTEGVENSRTFHVKPLAGCLQIVGFTSSTGAFRFVWDIASNTITPGVNCKSATVTAISNGWYVITVTSKATASANAVYMIAGVAATGSSAASFLSIGYQVEVGGPTPYQRITDFNSDFLSAFPAHTLFQDSAGTTPVTAVEQPVGLMLDKSKGLVLGSELVTNGTGDSTTGWVGASGGSVSASGGNLVLTATGGASFPNIQQTISVTAGKTYVVTVTGTTGTSGNSPGVNLAVGFTPVVNTAITSGQVNRYVLTATGSTATISLLAATGSATAGTTLFDNISVREIPGAHFIQTTPASRPTLSSRYNLLTKTEQFDDATWTKTTSGIVTITPNAAVAPDGTLSAEMASKSAAEYAAVSRHTTLTAGTHTLSVYVKAATSNLFGVRAISGATDAGYLFDVASGSLVSAITSSGRISQGADAIGNGWFRLWVSFTAVAGTCECYLYPDNPALTNALSSYIWGASLVPAADASLPYQRVNTATDYDFDFTKFPAYLKYDGVDDSQASAATVDLNGVVSDGQARRNLLSASEAFDDAAWTKTRASITPNATVAPDGTTTADKLVEDTTATSTHQTSRLVTTAAVAHTYSVYAKAAERPRLLLVNNSVANAFAIFDLSAGTVPTTGSAATSVIESVGNGWYRCSIAITCAAGSNDFQTRIGTASTDTYTGDGTSGIYVWGAQLEAGSTASAYQKTGTDKITVVGAWHKAGVASGMALESSTNADSSNGSFAFATSAWGDARDYFSARGTVLSYPSFTTTAPTSYVVSASSAVANDNITIRRNGVQVVNSSADLGTGTFGNYTTYVGSRAGSSLRFNGREYGHALFNTTLSASELAAVEAYFRAKSRAY